MTLVLLRHGAVDVAYHDRLYGGAEAPLSPEGRLASDELVRELGPVPINAIYSSDVERTLYLAEHLAAPRGLTVMPVPDLREIDRGDWQHRRRTDLEADSPGAWQAYMADPDHWTGHGGETGAAFMARIEKALDLIAERHPGGVVAIASHRHVVCAALARALDLTFKKALRIRVDYLSATMLAWRSEEPSSIHLVNGDAASLAARLRTS
ncbi:MAG: histidine phosphatase family protein [Planctomycetota bacterium]